MKKLILFIVMLCAIGMVAHAQTSTLSANPNALIKTLDTVTNTGVKTMTTVAIPGVRSEVTINTINTVLTGTLAGVARLYGSLDGITYFRIRNDKLRGSSVAVDSLVIDANHRVYSWVVEKNPYKYYQVQTTGIGTVTFTVAGKYAAH